jgi:adenylate cyclase class 2
MNLSLRSRFQRGAGSSDDPIVSLSPERLYWGRQVMSANQEIEVKFKIADIGALTAGLESAGFQLITGRTHEMNTLYDRPGQPLRRRGALLRIRNYGSKWTVTFKDRSQVQPGRHKSRREIETPVNNGQALAQILEALGFKPGFAYEKFRSEWTDGTGHVVIDETPIGNFGEIEGPPVWIDAVAGRLGISKKQYITQSYAELFLKWKKQTGNKVGQMLFPL